MSSFRFSTAFSLLLCSALTACFTPTHAEATWSEDAYAQVEIGWPEPADPGLPPALASRLSSWTADAPASTGSQVRPGDVLVYRLDRVQSGRRQSDYLWLEAIAYRKLGGDAGGLSVEARATATLTITLTTKDGDSHEFESESKLLDTELLVFGPDGEERSSSEPTLLIDLMAEGFVEDIETIGDPEEVPADPGQLEQVARAMMRQIYLAQTLGEDPTLFDIALELAGGWMFALDRLFSGSLSLNLDARTQDARPSTWPTAEGEPAWRFPIEVGISGKPAIRSVVTCIEPRGALQMTAGVVSASGFRASLVDTRYRLTLVAVGRSASATAAIPAEAVRIDRNPRRFPKSVLAFDGAVTAAPRSASAPWGAAGAGPSTLR